MGTSRASSNGQSLTTLSLSVRSAKIQIVCNEKPRDSRTLLFVDTCVAINAAMGTYVCQQVQDAVLPQVLQLFLAPHKERPSKPLQLQQTVFTPAEQDAHIHHSRSLSVHQRIHVHWSGCLTLARNVYQMLQRQQHVV